MYILSKIALYLPLEVYMANWAVNTARNHLSDVLDQAETEGPQTITHHGKERAVVLSIDAYRTLQSKAKPDFITYLLSGPKIDFEDWELERSRDTGREIDL